MRRSANGTGSKSSPRATPCATSSGRRVVREAFDVTPSEGRICIQTEGAELFARRFALYPIGHFAEPWPPKNNPAVQRYKGIPTP